MRIVSFDSGFGRVEGDVVARMGDDVTDWLSTGATVEGEVMPTSGVALRAPVPRPGKIICVGLNYRDHAKETGQAIPDIPILFPKYANSVIGPGAPIVVPAAVAETDYEAELGVVIGSSGARRISPEDAAGTIAGYTCLNDVSARDLQLASSQWTRGKAIDTFLPMGPWLVTADEIPDPQRLAIRCRVNGEVRQESNTSDMIFGVFELISFISQTMTLSAGDVIATGTPFGVGMGFNPPRYLADGDTVEVEIEGIGVLSNVLRSEGPPR